KAGVWEFDHTNSSFQEVCPSSATPDIIDWAGLIRLYDTSTSSYKYSIVALSFLFSETKIRLFDTMTNTWSSNNDDFNLGLTKITQALGSFIWVEQGNQANDAYMYILGGMSIKNNNLPVKQLQKVRFTLDNGNLKYEVDS